MDFWIFLYIITILLSLINNKFSHCLIVTLLFSLSMLRADCVGTDTINYINDVISTNETIDLDSENLKTYELSYRYVRNFISIANLPPYFIIITFSIITFVGLIILGNKFNLSLSLLSSLFLATGMYALSFNIARQVCAIIIVLIAFSFLLEKRWILFLIFTIFATTFHISSLIVLILIPIIYIRIPNYIPFIGMPLAFIIGFFLSELNLIDKIIELFSQHIFYLDLYNESIQEAKSLSSLGILYKFIELLIFMFIYQNKGHTAKASTMDLLFAFSTIICFLFNNLGDIASRILLLFKLFQVLYITLWVQEKMRQKKDVGIILYLFLFVYFSYASLSSIASGSGDVLAYTLRVF